MSSELCEIIKHVSSHELNSASHESTSTFNHLMDEDVKSDQTIGPGRRKRPPPAKNESNPTKINRNHDDGIDQEESLDTNLESSLTSSSSIDSNTECPKNELTGKNINIDSKQPPIVIMLNSTHTALSTHAFISEQCLNAIYENNGKTLTIHMKTKSITKILLNF